MSTLTRYDERYFDTWYRDPRRRVSTAASTTRKAALCVSMAEYYLGRKVRTVLDVGCGEGQWQPILAKLRPGIRYQGFDGSEYAIRRYGRRRNIALGTFGELDTLPLARAYDLVICSDMLYYVSRDDLDRGLAALAPRLAGVAFLEAYTNADEVEGDTRTWESRDAAFYRRLFRRHGLVSCGSHCYAGPASADAVMELERGG